MHALGRKSAKTIPGQKAETDPGVPVEKIALVARGDADPVFSLTFLFWQQGDSERLDFRFKHPSIYVQPFPPATKKTAILSVSS